MKCDGGFFRTLLAGLLLLPQVALGQAERGPSGRSRITVEARPRAAMISIAGPNKFRHRERGKWVGVDVVPGAYRFTVSLEGYSSHTRTKQLRAGDTVRLVLSLAQRGTLEIRGMRDTMTVQLSGPRAIKLRAKGEVTLLDLPSAKYTVSFHYKGALATSKVVVVRHRKAAVVDLKRADPLYMMLVEHNKEIVRRRRTHEEGFYYVWKYLRKKVTRCFLSHPTEKIVLIRATHRGVRLQNIQVLSPKSKTSKCVATSLAAARGFGNQRNAMTLVFPFVALRAGELPAD